MNEAKPKTKDYRPTCIEKPRPEQNLITTGMLKTEL